MEEQSIKFEQQVNDLQEQQENTNIILERIEDQLLEQEQKNEVKQDQEADVEEQTREAQQEQADTYTETLTDIKTNIDLTNHFLVGNMFFISVLIGVLIGKILWDRFIRL